MYDVVILISHKGQLDWKPLQRKATGSGDKTVMIVTDNGQVRFFSDEVAPFYVINENIDLGDITKKLSAILTINTDKTILIAIHHTIYIAIENELIKSPLCIYQPFQHESYYPIWAEYISPFIEAVVSGGNTDEALAKLRSFNNIYLAYRFRSELLTPFIPFHLACQTGDLTEWTPILEQCRDLMNVDRARKHLDGLITLLSPGGVSINTRTELHERLVAALKRLIDFCNDALESKKGPVISEVQKFAACLENVVNYIEFGGVLECQ